MIQDHYATLGVEPRSEAAAIRSAYLALMRRYHPDKNDSPAAVERAHAIIAAFAVLGDVERRLHYDWGRRRAAEAAEEARRSWRGWGPRAVMVVGGVLLLLVTVMVMPPAVVVAPPARVATIAPTPRVAEVAEPLVAPDTATMPANFLVPAPVVPKVFEPPAAVVAVAAPRPAEARVRPSPDKVDIEPFSASPVRAPRQMRAVATPKALPPTFKAKCRSARPGAEAIVCNDDNLGALEGNVLAFYNQSLVYGTAAKRAALRDARGGFLARREACHSAACLRDLHLSHLREMTTIVENRAGSVAQ